MVTSFRESSDLSRLGYPFVTTQCESGEVSHMHSDRDLYMCTLRTGERYYFEKPVVTTFKESICAEGPHVMPKLATGIISSYLQCGTQFARELYLGLLNEEAFAHQFVPYYVQEAIISASHLPDGAVFLPIKPKFSRFLTDAPRGTNTFSSEQCKNGIVTDDTLLNLNYLTPKLVSIVIVGISGYEMQYSPDYVLMREGAHGLKFPGGHAINIYDPASIRELYEEVSGSLVRKEIPSRFGFKGMQLLNVYDQFLGLGEGRFDRIRGHVYYFNTQHSFYHQYGKEVLFSNPEELFGSSIESVDPSNKTFWKVIPAAMLYYHRDPVPNLEPSSFSDQILQNCAFKLRP